MRDQANTGVLSGSSAYALEIWLSSTLLRRTFPLLTVYADLCQMWPLKH